MKLTCDHGTCKAIYKKNPRVGGTGTLLLRTYYEKATGVTYETTYGVKEDGGKYKDTINVVGGELEEGCYLECCFREYCQEFSPIAADYYLRNGNVEYEISEQWRMFNSIFKPEKTDTIQWFLKGNTVIFIGRLPSLGGREDISKKLREKKNKRGLKWCFIETSGVDLVDINTGFLIAGGPSVKCPTSSYMDEVIGMIHKEESIRDKVDIVLSRNAPRVF